MKNGTEVTFSPATNVIGNSNYEYNCPQKLLFINTQVSSLRKYSLSQISHQLI